MYGLFQDSLMEQVRQDGKLKIHQDAIQQLARRLTTRRARDEPAPLCISPLKFGAALPIRIS